MERRSQAATTQGGNRRETSGLSVCRHSDSRRNVHGGHKYGAKYGRRSELVSDRRKGGDIGEDADGCQRIGNYLYWFYC